MAEFGHCAIRQLSTFVARLGIILPISVKVIFNYANHIFYTELETAFAGRA